MISALLFAASLDTVSVLRPVSVQLNATPLDGMSGWCATSWRRDPERAVVYIDAVVRAEDVNPTCGPGQATVLVRPACVFSISEFVSLRLTTPYVVIICRPNAQGIPLTSGRPTERAL